MGTKFPGEGYHHLLVSSRDYEVLGGLRLDQWTREVAPRVGKGELTCPVCKGNEQMGELRRGRGTNFYWIGGTECVCRLAKFAYRFLRAKLPASLRQCDLKTVEPFLGTGRTTKAQRDDFERMRNLGTKGAIWYGAPGTGKSYNSGMLLREAVRRNIDALYKWYCNADDEKLKNAVGIWHVDGIQFYEREQEHITADFKDKEAKAQRRLITVDNIEKAVERGITPCVVLEELDKRRMTEFFANALFAIANALDKLDGEESGMRGQLVITTNLRPETFAGLFLNSDNSAVVTCGEALMRRIRKLEQFNLYE
jgi:hypothetical protein